MVYFKCLRILAFFNAALSLASCNHKKIAYINPVKLSQEYEGVQVKLRQFEATTGPWRAQVDTLAAELQRAGAKYQQESMQLTPAQRTAREQELGQRQQQLAQYRDAVMQKATAERQRLDKEVMDDINPYLKEYGAREGYTLILGATEAGNIVYADEAADITDEVLKGLNARYRQQHATKP